jgi:hypothetical protein
MSDLSQPKEGFVRKSNSHTEQTERTLIGKVYCECVSRNYQACLDANDFDYQICNQEKMQSYQCLHNTISFLQFEPVSKALVKEYSDCLYRFRNNVDLCTENQAVLHPHLDALFDRAYQNYNK